MYFNKHVTQASSTELTRSISSLTPTSIGSASSLVSNNSVKTTTTTPSSVKEALNILSKEGRFKSQFNRPALKPVGSNGEERSSFAKPLNEERSSFMTKTYTEKPKLAQTDSFRSEKAFADFPSNLEPETAISVPDVVTNTETVERPNHRKVEGYVGFANLPNQIYRKAVKKGFDFTLMVVGESGLGKSSLVNSMFLTDIYSEEYPGPSCRIKQTVNVDTTQVLLQESGVRLNLTIVDTPGFGDAIDNSDCWNPILDFVNEQYDKYLDAETRVNRVPFPDTRVHACLYFIAPTGHGLKPLDVEFMRKLQDKVNIIPLIAKSDSMVPEEIGFFKEQINRQMMASNIKPYHFPDESYAVLEEKEKQEYQDIKNRVPFAVVSSNTWIEPTPDGKKIRGRRYPWGVVDIENTEHCDFVPLRTMLIRTNLLDLVEVTNNVLYENFRCRKLATVAGMTLERIPNKNPLASLEEDKREHQARIGKMEREMQEVFDRKVDEKTKKLEASQQELEAKQQESTAKLNEEKARLEEKRRSFLEEKRAWEQLHNLSLDDVKDNSKMFDSQKRLTKTLSDNSDFGIKKRTLPTMSSFRMGR